MCISFLRNKEIRSYWIFIILTFNLVSFIPFSNEETYFALAKQFVDPQWIPGSFTLTEWPGTRLVSQYIIGGLLKYMSFEALAFWGRVAVFALTSIPLAGLLKHFRFRLLDGLLLIQVYVIAWQSFFAGEWIFKAFEGKTIAYIFVFYSLMAVFKRRYTTAVTMGALATWFHVLVGGWFMLAILLWRLVESGKFFKVVKEGLLYTLLISPFIYYLGKTILMDSRSVIKGVNLDWVYVYFRNSHHTAPFGTIDCFLKNFALGIVLSIVALVFFVKIRKKLEGPIAALNNLNIVIFSILFLFLLIGVFDVNGSILKFYTFRLSGLSLFLTFMELFILFRLFKKDVMERSKFQRNSTVALLLLFIAGTAGNLYSMKKGISRLESIGAVAVGAAEISKTGDVFMFLEDDAVEFIRKSRRERFVVYKFDPGGGEKIYDWYVRVLAKRKVEKDISELDELKKSYRIDFLISSKPLVSASLEEKWKNNKYWIYGVL